MTELQAHKLGYLDTRGRKGDRRHDETGRIVEPYTDEALYDMYGRGKQDLWADVRKGRTHYDRTSA